MRNWLGLGVIVGLLTAAGACGETRASSLPPLPGGDGDYTPGDGDSNPGGDGDYLPGDGDSAPGDGDNSPGDGDGDQGCGSIEKEADVSRGPVDIIWAVDSSGSMADEFLQVVTNLGAFADGLQTSGANAKVVMMNLFGILIDPVRDSQFGMDPNRYKYLPVNVDSWNSLRVLLDEYDNYKGFLRAGAPKHFIVVSDDESNLGANDFLTQMRGSNKLGGDFYFHAIVNDGTCGFGGVGNQYLSLADSTGGEKLPICSSDWSKLFKELESAVLESTPLPCDFEVPAPPPGETLDPNAVQVLYEGLGQAKTEFPKANDAAQCGDKTGWFFAGDRIEFCPTACELVKKGGSIAIGFGCEPTILY